MTIPTTNNQYFSNLTAAFVRGVSLRLGVPKFDESLLSEPLELLTDEEKQTIINAGTESGLKLHRFKRGHVEMSRVRRTLGFLQGIMPQSILDIGSGRGAFLWSCLDAIHEIPVTASDIDENRVELYETVRLGGIERLHGVRYDIQNDDSTFQDKEFDVVTMLEVLEHLQYPAAALENAVRIAERYVVISVPSKPDDNPEHLHLFSQRSLSEMFERVDRIKRCHFDYVVNHLFAFLTLEP